TLARLLFCFENDPENRGHVSGAQDAIGICMSGLTRHHYDGRYWPDRMESCHDEEVLSWLERHIVLVPMFPRRPGCSVVEGKDITPEKVRALTGAADRCWDAIMRMDLDGFAEAFRDSFEAQVAMFPAMMQPGVAEHIDRVRDRALAWKMLGAGGGGHLALVVPDGFEPTPDMIPIRIRRV
ncbi:MAG: cytidyltransferase, partial [Muribaculaceae bacterium]|nr:cytidyltransferase [Muribaculaceae bacterium]